jgi:hemolysin activation/secretion protein
VSPGLFEYSNKAMSKSLLICFSSALALQVIVAGNAHAEQAPILPNDAIPPGNRGPRPEPPTPQRKPLPNIPLPPTTPSTPTTQGGSVNVTRYKVKGSTIFSAADFDRVTKPFTGKGTAEQIEKARAAIEKLYYDAGYRTTIAGVPPAQDLSRPGLVVTIEVQESTVSEVQITGTKRVSQEYIRSRLRISNKPFNYDELVQAISLLQRDPLFSNVSSEVRTGRKPGTNVVVITVEEKSSRSVYLSTDSNRSADFGDWYRGVELGEGNLTGGGDKLSLFYNNTSGSFGAGLTYSTPINSDNTRISLSASNFSSRQIIGPPSNLDIRQDNRNYSVGIRHPLLRRTGNNFEEELGVGFSVSKLDSDSSTNQVSNGPANNTTLNFTQDYSQTFGDSAISANSNFRIGIDALGATTTPDGFLDGRFVIWTGSTYYSKNLGNNNLLFLTGGVQLADRPLINSVLSSPFLYGYSPNTLSNDNGAYATAGLSLPVYQQNNITLTAIPSLNFGTTWGSITSSDPTALASAGIGLQLSTNNINARVDWGLPLVYTNVSRDNRLSFSLNYSLLF